MKFVRRQTGDGPTLAVLADEETLADLPAQLTLPQLLADDGRLHEAGQAAPASR